ncbi:MAG TPA: ABC transporter family substrate-binding protein [Streptosporangiaceae bacterium]|jgi:peptide/nickel transport system substrate-binding protein|nr:ABC transporter family substrate-binding protein [Streptosporangiaceae bacterium]
MLDRRARLTGLSLTLGLLLVLSACGGGTSQEESTSAGLADCTKNPNSCNSGTTKKGGSFAYVIEKDIELWNINDTNANTFETAEVLQTLLPGVFNITPDLKPTLNTDLMASVTKTGDNPQTIVYKIQPNAVWSDGTPITVNDFVYAWKTQNGRDCPLPPESDDSGTRGCNPNNTAGYDRIKSITGADGGKTVTAVFSRPYADWQNLFGAGYGLLPAHIAKQYGGDLDSVAGLAKAWHTFNTTPPKFSGGPYIMQNWQKGNAATLVPNPRWYGKTKPTLGKLIFRVISDAAQEPTALQNNEVQGIYPQPQVDLVSQVKKIPNVTYAISHGLTWEHFDFNLKTPALRDKTLRQAMFTAVDRKALIAKTVGQFTSGVVPLGSHNYVPGQPGYKDLVSPTGQGSGNVARARQMLTQAGYTGVGTALKDPQGETVGPFKIRYTTGNAIRKTQCELFQAQMKQLGINVTIEEIGADKLGQVLAGGQYDVIVFAWVAPPFPTNSAAQNWTTAGGGNYGKYSNKQVDKLIDDAAAASDPAQAAELLNKADAMVVQDAYVLPLYQKPTFLAVQTRFVNIRNNSTNTGPPYNTEEWGLRGAA